ncbi:MAG TPA: TraB/GumN family protein [Allosphingosinicella sp.]|uniref:TraB/GumN family protein n=1 Tax=Allosphingosinicella sp. TaxID=2823234 RepID=UPI002ED98110
MKLKKLLAALAAAAAIPVAAPANAPVMDADPALWVVKDADTTIYLFGTIHLLDGRHDWFNGEVRSAFDASSELVLEADLPENPADLRPIVMKYAVDPLGRTLSSRLTPELRAQFAREVGTIGLPARNMERLEPWFASMVLTAYSGQKLGLKTGIGTEAVLKRAATYARKKVSELEGAEDQIRMMDALPETSQLAFMKQTLDANVTSRSRLQPMMNAWSSGDAEGLARLVKQGIGSDPGLYKAIISDRNARWADWVGERLQTPGTVFVAVGAGHLGGTDSVQTMLRARGVGTERIG